MSETHISERSEELQCKAILQIHIKRNFLLLLLLLLLLTSTQLFFFSRLAPEETPLLKSHVDML
jgi:hypothetical protein